MTVLLIRMILSGLFCVTTAFVPGTVVHRKLRPRFHEWHLQAASESKRVEDELMQKAKELGVDLASIDATNKAEEEDLFKLFEVLGDLSKKTKLRTLIREQQLGEFLITDSLCIVQLVHFSRRGLRMIHCRMCVPKFPNM